MTSDAGDGPAAGRTCRVWWARPAAVRPWHWDLLSEEERRRYQRLLREEDRARSVVGAALLRLAAAAVLGADPTALPIDRTCDQCGEPHGKPRLPESTAMQCSVSHSGDRVAVALCPEVPLGVDVEALDRRGSTDIARLVLTEDELRGWEKLPEAEQRPALYEYWTRKEAVLKATGEGLRSPMSSLGVTPPWEPPGVTSFPQRRDLDGTVAVYPLTPGAGYAAAVALLSAEPHRVEETWADALLDGSGS